MRRTILLCILLCNSLCNVLSLVRSRKAIQWRHHQNNNSATVAIGNDLYTVSQIGRAALNVRTSKDDKVNCVVRNDPRVNHIDGKLKATALNDNQPVVVWAEQWTRDPRKSRYIVQLINSWDCYTKGLVIVEDEVPSDVSQREPQVVTFDDSFDLYLPSRRKCSPCRFDNRGRNVYLRGQVEFEDVVDSNDEFLIQPISPGKPRQYVHVNNFGNGTAVVRILNGDFYVLREQFVDHKIDVISANHYVDPVVTVCYSKLYKRNQRFIQCDGFDDDLQLIFSVRPHVPVKLNNAKMVLGVDLLGNSHVEVAYYDVKNQMLQRSYFRYDRFGLMSDKVIFAGIPMKSDPKYWELFGYPLEQKYCVSIVIRKDIEEFEGDEIIECIESIDSDDLYF